MQKVLIVGSTGYLGKYLVQECKRRGLWVRALARSPEKLEPLRDSIDDLFVGEVTKPETLQGVCDDIDVVISALGVASSRTDEKITQEGVDYEGNKNVLDRALSASVKKFIFVSFIISPDYENLEITRIKRKFEQALDSSGIDYCIIRPTAFFSDMKEILKLAQKGTVYLLGHGNYRGNPIHGIDLAQFCVDAIERKEKELPVGGPDEYSYRESAELAFKLLEKQPKIKTIPGWPLNGLLKLMKPFLSKRKYTSLQFLFCALQSDALAPKFGTHTLEDFFREIAGKG
jgi:uncharacterized protein YbjT (DUF2867 family)